MAKGDVTLTFDANVAKYVQACIAARNATIDVANASRDLGNTAGKSGESMLGLAGKLIGVSSAAGAVTGAVAVAGVAMQNYFDRMEERGTALLTKLNQINSAVSLSGNQSLAPQVMKDIGAMKTVSGMVVNPTTATEQYASIAAAMGGRGKPQDIFAAMKTAQIGLASGRGGADAQMLGVNFAQLARERRPGGAFEGQSDEQLQDMAAKLQENGVTLGEQEMKVFEQMKDKGAAVNLLSAAGESSQSMRSLTSLMGIAEKGGAGSLDRIMGGNLNAVPAKERPLVRALIEGAGKVASRGDVSLSGEAAREGGIAASDPMINALRTSQNASALKETLTASTGLADLRKLNNQQLNDLIFRTAHPGLSNLEVYGKGLPSYLSAVHNLSGTDPEVYGKTQLKERIIGDMMTHKKLSDDPSIPVLVQILKAIQEGNRNGKNTALKNDSAGQQ